MGRSAGFSPWGLIATFALAPTGKRDDATTRRLHPLCPRMGFMAAWPDQLFACSRPAHPARCAARNGGAEERCLAAAFARSQQRLLPALGPPDASRSDCQATARDGFSAAAAGVAPGKNPPQPMTLYPAENLNLLPGERFLIQIVASSDPNLPTLPPPSATSAEDSNPLFLIDR